MTASYQPGDPVDVRFPTGWLPGTYTGERAGLLDEKFQRIDVELADGRAVHGCHPDCVRPREVAA